MTASPDVGSRLPRILIVDDELHERKLLEVMLKPEGFLLLTAASGKEALAILAQEPQPDLVLLDVMMPHMDGHQVADRIKGSLATRNIPIIMITVLDDRKTRMLGLNAGAEDLLTKPVDRAELCVRVRNLLRLKAYGAHFDQYSQTLEAEVASRTVDLRDERDRSQRFLDTAAAIMLALDTDGRVTLANRFACTVLGWTEAELLGRDWINTCLPARVRAASRLRLEGLLNGNPSVSENLILTRAGEERLIEWRNTVLRDDTGRVTGTFSSGTDITERALAAEALQTAEERMRVALSATGVGIWDMDFVTGKNRWSETLESQYGLKPGTFGGTFEAFLAGVHPEDRPELLETMAEASNAGADFSLLHRALWADGTVRWLSATGRIHLGKDGKPLRGVGISQDVTERRTLERQNQQALKMQAVGQLASGVAHDFNNLLTVILGCAELVALDTAVTPHHAEDLGEIIKAALRARGLTQQLLAFSRQQVLQAAPLDLNKLITDMTGMLGLLIGNGIQVKLDLAPKLSLAFADRGQMEQVVMNLVVNARDAMPDGGRVTIETKDVELESSSIPGHSSIPEEPIMEGQYVMVAVTDTGTGMSRETRNRLFEPFYTTKEPGKGTGLGLSTTYGIVKQSKGYIWVHSEPGEGTTFKVYLPRSNPDVPVPAAAPAPTPAIKRASQTVLLVDHETSVRRLSLRILADAGYQVLETSNGYEAEKVLAQHSGSIDLLVTDVVMPEDSGPELFSRLKARAPGLRVLFMSGHTGPAAARKAGIDRGTPFVQKPFTGAELVRQIRAALDG
ncbi:MAG: response regulator [Gemmatimonadales bacterium]